MKWTKWTLYFVAVASLLCAGVFAMQAQQSASAPVAHVDPTLLQSLHWRSIGPFRAGRAPAVAGDPKNPLVFYFGAVGGGVWKTYDAGLYWQNISDAYFKSSSVGAIAVAPSDPNVIYVGTGEMDPHPDILGGDGVYKSTDAGKTWANVGLRETQHIGRILVDPKNPSLVYVAALGHEFGPNPERGVFRSKDGGQTWEKILFVSDRAGAADMSMDPSNPGVIYASIWQFMRQPWSEISGGPDSGFYKTTDGGDHWTNISRNPGLPKGVLGKIRMSVAASRPNRVYAVVEAADGGLFRSEDAGATWKLINNSRDFRSQASWYSLVVADPQDPDVIYVHWIDLFKSTDGGRTFSVVAQPHGDNHSMWIDPTNNKRMIEGSDGGVIVTLNGGNSWSSEYNQPTAAYFKMAVDNQYPYRVYGTQMDNGAISCPSQTSGAAIEWADCYQVGHAESGFIAVRPDNPNIVFAGAVGSSEGGGGNMYKFDRRTGEQQMITVWPEDRYGSPVIDVKYRFYFTFPLMLSPHDPNILYTAAQNVFRSNDMGHSWQSISPDLTKNDKSHMMVLDGGPITSQQFSSQYTSTLYSFAESPLKAGELWAGSDNVSIHYSPDAGKQWLDRSPKDLPEWTGIYTVEVSSHRPGTVYIAANRHELDDDTPYIEKTADYGKTWQRIDNGIPKGDYVWVVREDPVRAGLLYAGTENGVFLSLDDGAHWQSLQRNMPVVAVRDMIVKDNDLVAATHGRSFWILDNITPLRQITPAVLESSVTLFKVPMTYRPLGRGFGGGGGAADLGKAPPEYLRISGDGIGMHETLQADGTIAPTYVNAGMNPSKGVLVTYYLKQKPEGPVTLTFLDSTGHTIKQFASGGRQERGARVTTAAGTNSFVWDMNYPGPHEIPVGEFLPLEWARARAPVAVPGMYKVRLNVDGKDYEQSFEIRKDPRTQTTQQELQAQFDLMVKLREEITAVTDAVERIHKDRAQAAAAAKQTQDVGVRDAATKLDGSLTEIEGRLVRLINHANPMMLPPKTLNIRLAALSTVVQSADSAPTKQSYEVFAYLSGQVSDDLKQLTTIEQDKLAALLKSAGVPAQ